MSASGAGAVGASPGLVSYETSDTPTDKTRLLIDPVESRYKRMRCGTTTTTRLHHEHFENRHCRVKVAMLTLIVSQRVV